MQASVPSLSVVIPTFNRKESLRVTLDGLARQQYALAEIEVIVVSDGSTDGTDAFLEEYARTAPYLLRFIPQANQGPACARNTGVWAASGEVIVFIDDDVEPVANFFTNHMRHHQDDDKIVVIGPMSPDPNRRGVEPPWIAWEHAMLQKQYFNLTTGVWKRAGANHFYTGNVSLRREHIVAVGGFDVEFKRQEDVELAYRMQRRQGVAFLFDPEADVIHRPYRSFGSWLNVAASYGTNDIVRAREGKVDWDVVRNNFHRRNRTTKIVARGVMRHPFFSAPLRRVLVFAAVALYRFGVTKPALGMLSVVYNVHYLENAQSELGVEEMNKLLFDASKTPARARRIEHTAAFRAHGKESDASAAAPVISAVVCTRNRGHAIVATVASILAIDTIDFELLVLDQSTNDETVEALAAFEGDRRLRVLRSQTKGLGLARNIGLEEARCDLIAFTDDDCTVPKEWLDEVHRAFQADPKIAIVFSSVEAAPHDKSKDFIPAYKVWEERVFTGLTQKRQTRGIGAGMSVRVALVQKLGGFDVMLGAGGYFPSCEDWDIAVRALLHGYSVMETDSISVLHFGLRSQDEFRLLTKRDWIGIGAAFSKPIRCGYPAFAIVIVNLLAVYTLRPLLRDLLRLRKPRSLMRVVYFLRGFQEGLRMPIDRETIKFNPASEPDSSVRPAARGFPPASRS